MGRKIQKDLALELYNMLPKYNEEGFTFNDIKNVKLALDIQINVICAENLNTLIYKGEDKETKIYLYKNGNHFDVIKSAKDFYGSSYYCNKCDIRYKKLCKLCTYYGEKFEHSTQQETGTHIANKIIVHGFEGNKIMFDTNEEFCKHVISEKYRGYTLIAHNAKGYDSQFTLKYLVDNILKPFTIYNGTKLMLLQIKYLRIRIIDSSNFIQGPLSSFPKTFGLKELKKSYFPHFFNTVENQNYIGILPDKKYYGVEIMKLENKIEFEKWYNEKINENYLFNFKEELESYCNSDVNILQRVCLELRKQFLDIANINPFCYTIIAEDTIAVLDKEKNESYSKQSITWLQNFNNKNISHALNGGKKTIAEAKVDGFDNKSKMVYQYHGCFWHGCTKCYKDRETINNTNHETMDDSYQKTIERSTAIKNAGYNLVEQWECDWINSFTYKKMKKADIADPINPRDAFFGGRTNATKLRVKSTKMRYIDVCSLYPTELL
ncbi:hypothetical protein QTP88_029334 [Uroleucon formosanum]